MLFPRHHERLPDSTTLALQRNEILKARDFFSNFVNQRRIKFLLNASSARASRLALCSRKFSAYRDLISPAPADQREIFRFIEFSFSVTNMLFQHAHALGSSMDSSAWEINDFPSVNKLLKFP